MGVGDVPTWVAAVAAWAGVVVNGAIVFVALSPIRTAKRERTARGRLVASHLYTPMAYSAALLKAAHPAILNYTKVTAGRASADVRPDAERLQTLCIELRSQLESYDLKEVAFLPGEMGQLLSNGVGQVRVCIGFLETSVGRYFSADVLDAIPADKLRFAAANHLGFMVERYGEAMEQMAGFAKVCRSMLGIPEVSSPSVGPLRSR